MTAPRRLGRGLEALLGDTGAAAPALGARDIPVDAIVANPSQPRARFDRDRLDALVASVREHGIVQPVVVSEGPPGRYTLIAGERRWRAAQLAGLLTLPAVVREAGDLQRLELALIENLQRADLTPIEEARAFRRLGEEFGLTQEAIAARAGRSRAAVANTLRLLQLPEVVQHMVDAGALGEGHARALLALGDEAAIVRLAHRVVDEALNVRQVEDVVRRLKATRESPRRQAPRSAAEADTRDLEGRFREALATRVRLVRRGRGGTLTIYFSSEEELDAIYTVVSGGRPR